MDPQAESLQQNVRRANCVRVCSFLFLLLSTMIIFRVEQSRGPPLSRNSAGSMGPIQFEWEMAPFLKYTGEVLSSVHLSASPSSASVFRSYRLPHSIGEDNSHPTVMGNGLLFWEQKPFSSWSDGTSATEDLPAFQDSVEPSDATNNTYVSQSLPISGDVTAIKLPSATSSRVAMAVDTWKLMKRSTINNVTGCALGSLCLVSLDKPASKGNSCGYSFGSHTLVSRSCLEVLSHSVNEETTCLRLRTKMLPTSFRAGEAVKYDWEEVLRFCGRPVRDLLAVDGTRARVFLLERQRFVSDMVQHNHDYGEPFIHKNKTTGASLGDPENRNSARGRATADNATQLHSSEFLFSRPSSEPGVPPFCITTVTLTLEYPDVTDCVPLPVPSGLDIDLKRPPLYLHYDAYSNALAVFRFDITGSLVMTAFDSSAGHSIRFSKRFVRMHSGWLLTSSDSGAGTVLIIGDHPPYVGSLHVINLLTGQNVRMKLDGSRTRAVASLRGHH